MVALAGQIVFSFGLAAFASLFVLWFRQPAERRAHSPYGFPFLYSSLWFGANLWTTDFALLLAAASGFPAVLLHLFRLPGVPLTALAGAGSGALALASWAGWTPLPAAAAAFSTVLATALWRSAVRGKAGRGSGIFLFACIAAVPLALYAGTPGFRLFVRSLPLSLLLLDSYMRRRFLFFDLFVKWGLSFLLALSLLAATLAALPAHWNLLSRSLILAPLVWLIPRACRTLGRLVDRKFLGRPFSPATSEQRLVEALRSSADEHEVARAAERELSLTFGVPVQILEGTAETLCETSLALPLESEPPLQIAIGGGTDARPFFSQDLEQLRTLARLTAYAIENRRLEANRRLSAESAAQSELKALRAQINPHFLFNALNTVAGLIPRRPELAESVVERLAEVFRYTLRRSEAEWATLGEELETVRAYLEVEQARYGARLAPMVEVAQELLRQRIPSMTLLTLVENAIKHGVARCPGACHLVVEAAIQSGRMTVVVRNGGPAPAGAAPDGYGLRNVRQRLQVHYGGEASLELTRDEIREETVARMEVPAC
jgi:hypothetical protein